MTNLKQQIFINIIITVLITSLLWWLFARNEANHIRDDIRSSIRIHTEQVDAFFSETIAAIENIATTVTYEQSIDKINNKIQMMKNRDPRIINYYVLDHQAKVLNSNSEAMIGKTIASAEFFNHHDNRTWNNVAISHVSKNMMNKNIIYLSKPITINHRRRLIVAEVDINTIGTVIDSLQKDKTVTITDFDKHIIFQSNHPVKSSIKETQKFLKVDWNLTINTNKNVYFQVLQKALLSGLVTSLLIATLQLFYRSHKTQLENEMLLADINAQKKELIGQMAANTAHEIKNPLTSIIGFVELLELQYDKERKNHYFSIIKTELERINLIVGQFLLLGKPTKLDVEVVDLREIVRETIAFMDYDLTMHNIRTVKSYTDHQTLVYVAIDQFKQIIINLVQNAKEAIDAQKQGIIEIKVDHTQTQAILTIRDNGCGMSKEILNQLFDPFFTTKQTGTGLGLPVSKSIIEANNGEIKVISKVGVGSTFIIKLPLISIPSEYDK
ncbi:ATP-binding protein [Macrococcus capreoli]|uniref:ATP-binding protein n=1 Tax=Macrococcus capreoli TaxID=2982690 RepID=UPI0021D5ECD2|nr:ATP-binding protein [Macrococcus sp. TMW 2.2395]MCU7557504.1 ATP-binding protein [Macrococcus sp. TMW 2.2395]